MSRVTKSPEPSQYGQERALPPAEPGPARKSYSAPRLKVYGRLAELTRFGGSVLVDSGGGLGRL